MTLFLTAAAAVFTAVPRLRGWTLALLVLRQLYVQAWIVVSSRRRLPDLTRLVTYSGQVLIGSFLVMIVAGDVSSSFFSFLSPFHLMSWMARAISTR